jgi:hypothetical protein
VRQHGGKLRYEDAPRGGARFTIEIPAAQVRAPLGTSTRPGGHGHAHGLMNGDTPAAPESDASVHHPTHGQAIARDR